MLAHSPHQQVRLDAIEERLDIEINDPVVTPASLPRHAYRIERRFAGTISIGILMEFRLHLGSRWRLTTICAMRSATVGMPNGRVLPSLFGISTRRTGGGK